MRISGGEFRGIKLASFAGRAIRPTPEHVRESIFNIIGHHLQGIRVLDLFAGTGVLGLEALSRGASRVLLVDKSSRSLSIIKKNIAILKVEPRAMVLRHDLTRGLNPILKRLPEFELVFVDPPYGKNLASVTLEKLDTCPGLLGGAMVIVEHFAKELKQVSLPSLQLEDRRAYGQTLISIFVKAKTN